MTDEIKPCPFCGSEPTVRVDTPDNMGYGNVWAHCACYKCEARPDVAACKATFEYSDKNPYKPVRFREDEEAMQLALREAINAWNKRA